MLFCCFHGFAECVVYCDGLIDGGFGCVLEYTKHRQNGGTVFRFFFTKNE